MLTVLHITFSSLSIAPWFVPMWLQKLTARITDGPSRFDFAFARDTLRAAWLAPVMLTRAQWAAKHSLTGYLCCRHAASATPDTGAQRVGQRTAKKEGERRRARARQVHEWLRGCLISHVPFTRGVWPYVGLSLPYPNLTSPHSSRESE